MAPFACTYGHSPCVCRTMTGSQKTQSDCCAMCTDAGQRRRPGAGSVARRAPMAVLAACAAACLCTHRTDAKLTYGAPPRRPSWLPSTSPSGVALNSLGQPRTSAEGPQSQDLPVGSLWAGCAHSKHARAAAQCASVGRTGGPKIPASRAVGSIPSDSLGHLS